MGTDIDYELKTLNERLRKVAEGFQNIKEAGIDEEILVSYMCYKLKKRKKEVERMLKCQEDFYDKMVKKITIKRLKE